MYPSPLYHLTKIYSHLFSSHLSQTFYDIFIYHDSHELRGWLRSMPLCLLNVRPHVNIEVALILLAMDCLVMIVMISVLYMIWQINHSSLWCHNIEMISILLALCEGNPLVTSGFPSQRASNSETFYDIFIYMNRVNGSVPCRRVCWMFALMSILKWPWFY